MLDRPPCWPEGRQCPNNCAAQLYQRVVHNQHDLTGPWAGWRFRGRHLVSPHNERIAPHLLDRWLYRHARMFER